MVQTCEVGVGGSLSGENPTLVMYALLLDCTLSLVLRSFGRCTVLTVVLSQVYTVVHLLLEEFRISLKSS